MTRPSSVAAASHQIGMAHYRIGRYDAAEVAYRKSLEINTQIGNRVGQASSLGELGNLYDYGLKRLEDAIIFYKQAAEIHVELGDLRHQGIAHHNIAKTLYRLNFYDEAREQILQAIKCYQPYGTAVGIWKSFNILYKVEVATKKLAAAQIAWQQARRAYFIYRQEGGQAQFDGGKLVQQILDLLNQQQNVPSLFEELAALSNEPGITASLKQLIQAIAFILNGSRDPALADDPALDYDDAAEVLFLIERLSSQVPGA
ncbi:MULTISPECIES: tetratricopeptide repeat protein [Cyanophyceae]|uniref:tetratricopeptide repeat protein n=1 Tax=Cyanophyceae TaxID=3028117 RepID=UPI0016886DC2|nr:MULTISPECIES: tetratricopeptide repeat protein [Cyanophyceae]MBD1915386.1 tetratricopeptide repeat protein [Phormidium sp. FACHB-77]MBD2032387.1 tetratricopeptide repeat protein [Phormidium sp. FACHB-322]MBD2052558.1 tetratricopeptide repeat protein [Leptolyngbya sp. FACHB-60]